MQAFLLHAKSLGAAESLAVVSNNVATVANGVYNDQTSDAAFKETAVGVDSSCSPKQYQIDHYNQLHSTKAVTGQNGNTLYYALRAMETHQNRILSATTAAEDNAVIASISDQSRLTPAGMETANKAICAKILQELDAEASVISNTALCPWDYICDYKAYRFPNYLFKARCKSSKCSGNCSGQENNRHNMCRSHGIHVTVLQMTRSCEEWVWGQELVPIACTCTDDIMMKV